MQPGSGETRVLYVLLFFIFSFHSLFHSVHTCTVVRSCIVKRLLYYRFPNSVGDGVIIQVQNSKGQHCGQALVKVAAIADEPVKFSEFSNSFTICKKVDIYALELNMYFECRATRYDGGLYIVVIWRMNLSAEYN